VKTLGHALLVRRSLLLIRCNKSNRSWTRTTNHYTENLFSFLDDNINICKYV